MKKIVVIGPESTGKSTLCAQLAKHYNTVWCPEFSREYLLDHGITYVYDDLLTIAKGQVSLEEQTIKHTTNELIFIDTDLYVMKVWSEFVFDKCDPWILNEIANRQYDLYLLCDIDIPWQKDVLRENPDLASRQVLYHIYRDLMMNQPTPWVTISGSQDDRFDKACNIIDQMFPLIN